MFWQKVLLKFFLKNPLHIIADGLIKELYMIIADKGNQQETQEVFLDLNNGEYLQFDMTLQMQILFDDAMTFISRTDFEV